MVNRNISRRSAIKLATGGVAFFATTAVLNKLDLLGFAESTSGSTVTITPDDFSGLATPVVVIDSDRLGNWGSYASGGCSPSIENNTLNTELCSAAFVKNNSHHTLMRFVLNSDVDTFSYNNVLQLEWRPSSAISAGGIGTISGGVSVRFSKVAYKDGYGSPLDLVVRVSNIKLRAWPAGTTASSGNSTPIANNGIPAGGPYYVYPLVGVVGASSKGTYPGDPTPESWPSGIGTISVVMPSHRYRGVQTINGTSVDFSTQPNGGNNNLYNFYQDSLAGTVSWDIDYYVYESGTTTPVSGNAIASYFDIDQPGVSNYFNSLGKYDVDTMCESIHPRVGFTETSNSKTVLHAKSEHTLVARVKDSDGYGTHVGDTWIRGTASDTHVTEAESVSGFKAEVSAAHYGITWQGTRCFTYLSSGLSDPEIVMKVGAGGNGVTGKSVNVAGSEDYGVNAAAYNHEQNFTFTWTPDTNYRVAKVIVDGTDVTASVTNNQYVFKTPTIDHEIIVEFEKDTGYVTFNKRFENGS